MDKTGLVQDIIRTGALLWEKNLVAAFNGNLSARFQEGVLLTATGSCLGFLTENHVAHVDLNGRTLNGIEPSSEKSLHLAVYGAFLSVNAVLHTHTPYINAFFLKNGSFVPRTFEAERYLGRVQALDQETINVKDVGPVLQALKHGKILVLRRHGVVSVGADLFECFARVQLLEEQIRIEALARFF